MTKDVEKVILDYYSDLYTNWLDLSSCPEVDDDEWLAALAFASSVGTLCDELGLDTGSIRTSCLNRFFEDTEAGA